MRQNETNFYIGVKEKLTKLNPGMDGKSDELIHAFIAAHEIAHMGIELNTQTNTNYERGHNFIIYKTYRSLKSNGVYQFPIPDLKLSNKLNLSDIQSDIPPCFLVVPSMYREAFADRHALLTLASLGYPIDDLTVAIEHERAKPYKEWKDQWDDPLLTDAINKNFLNYSDLPENPIITDKEKFAFIYEQQLDWFDNHLDHYNGL